MYAEIVGKACVLPVEWLGIKWGGSTRLKTISIRSFFFPLPLFDPKSGKELMYAHYLKFAGKAIERVFEAMFRQLRFFCKLLVGYGTWRILYMLWRHAKCFTTWLEMRKTTRARQSSAKKSNLTCNSVSFSFNPLLRWILDMSNRKCGGRTWKGWMNMRRKQSWRTRSLHIFGIEPVIREDGMGNKVWVKFTEKMRIMSRWSPKPLNNNISWKIEHYKSSSAT